MPVSSNELLDIQATIECRFYLKCVRDMIITYSQMHLTDKYSQHNSIIWLVWLKIYLTISQEVLRKVIYRKISFVWARVAYHTKFPI